MRSFAENSPLIQAYFHSRFNTVYFITLKYFFLGGGFKSSSRQFKIKKLITKDTFNYGIKFIHINLWIIKFI